MIRAQRTPAERGVILGGLGGFALQCMTLLMAFLEVFSNGSGATWWGITSLPALAAFLRGGVPDRLLGLLVIAGPSIQWALLGFLIGRAVEGRRRFAGIGMLIFAGALFLLSVWVYLAPYSWWLRRSAVNGAVYANAGIGLVIWTVGVWLVARNEHVVRRTGPAIGYDAITNQRLPKGDE